MRRTVALLLLVAAAAPALAQDQGAQAWITAYHLPKPLATDIPSADDYRNAAMLPDAQNLTYKEVCVDGRNGGSVQDGRDCASARRRLDAEYAQKYGAAAAEESRLLSEADLLRHSAYGLSSHEYYAGPKDEARRAGRWILDDGPAGGYQRGEVIHLSLLNFDDPAWKTPTVAVIWDAGARCDFVNKGKPEVQAKDVHPAAGGTQNWLAFQPLPSFTKAKDGSVSVSPSVILLRCSWSDGAAHTILVQDQTRQTIVELKSGS